jgi:hypothetical protein
MATRKAGSRSRQSTAASGNERARAITDSAQKIWLAGLGAFERARAEGPRMFDTLVAQGKGLGDQARDAADQALRSLKESASGASGISTSSSRSSRSACSARSNGWACSRATRSPT